ARLRHAADRRDRHVGFIADRDRERIAAPSPPHRSGRGAESTLATGKGGGGMTQLVYLIPVALFLGGVSLVAFLWALRSGQYEDLDGAAERMLLDADAPED